MVTAVVDVPCISIYLHRHGGPHGVLGVDFPSRDEGRGHRRRLPPVPAALVLVEAHQGRGGEAMGNQ
jgi:hypothetical protein